MRIRAILPVLLCPLMLLAGSPSASDLYSQGRKAEKAGHLAEAYLLYARAAALKPQSAEYWQKAQSLQLRAELEVADAAKAAAAPSDTVDSNSESDSNSDSDTDAAPAKPEIPTIRALPAAPPPPTLAGSSVRKDFDLAGNSRQLFEQVGAAYGLEATFDEGYDAGVQNRFRLKGVDYREALHALELATASFIVPLSNTRFLVAKDNTQKRAELEPAAAVHVELPEALTQQDFTSLVTAVQQSTAVERFAFIASSNSVEMRDRVSKVLPARDLFQQLAYPRAEVAFEMKLLQVSRNDAITYGLDLQSQIPVIAAGTWLNNKPSIPSGVTGLLGFGGGKTLIGLGVMSSSLVAKMSESSGKILMDALLRSIDDQPATMLVGERYPILTAGYFGPRSTTDKSYTPTPSFNYENLGLALKVTPTVHGRDEVTLDVDAEYKVLSGVYVNGMPVIASRVLKSKVRLGFGEWVAVAGLLDEQEAKTVAGLAGLSRIPLLAPLFAKHDRNKSAQEVFILMRPYLLSAPASEKPPKTLSLGSETRPLTRF